MRPGLSDVSAFHASYLTIARQPQSIGSIHSNVNNEAAATGIEQPPSNSTTTQLSAKLRWYDTDLNPYLRHWR